MTRRALSRRAAPTTVDLRGGPVRPVKEAEMKILPAMLVTGIALAPAAVARDFEVPFETGPTESVIVVRGMVNKKPAVLILDTGSSRTILRPELVEPDAQPLAPSLFSDRGPGLRAHGRSSRATVRLGEKTWRRAVVAMNFDEVSRAYGMRVDGLLGQDLLREFDRVTIDFRASKIIFISKGREPSGSNGGE
jgi:hypothetical protein